MSFDENQSYTNILKNSFPKDSTQSDATRANKDLWQGLGKYFL